MTRVQAPSRLHFGLLNVGGATVTGRHFGSVGLMIESPGVVVSARPAVEWSATGPLAGRALALARQFASTADRATVRPLAITVERAAPEHAGLGTGTQLGLAIARAAAAVWGLADLDAPALARRVGRGARSALGVHGFAHGGLLVEAGKHHADQISPLVARHELPASWAVVVALPAAAPGLHGTLEAEAFEALRRGAEAGARTDRLCRLVLLGLLPAVVEADYPAFGEALYEFNAEVGEAFSRVQGGRYASRQAEHLVEFVRQQGVPAVGQSSWGPAVFAVTATRDQADALTRAIRERFALGPDEVWTTAPCNRGALVEAGG